MSSIPRDLLTPISSNPQRSPAKAGADGGPFAFLLQATTTSTASFSSVPKAAPGCTDPPSGQQPAGKNETDGAASRTEAPSRSAHEDGRETEAANELPENSPPDRQPESEATAHPSAQQKQAEEEAHPSEQDDRDEPESAIAAAGQTPPQPAADEQVPTGGAEIDMEDTSAGKVGRLKVPADNARVLSVDDSPDDHNSDQQTDDSIGTAKAKKADDVLKKATSQLAVGDLRQRGPRRSEPGKVGASRSTRRGRTPSREPRAEPSADGLGSPSEDEPLVPGTVKTNSTVRTGKAEVGERAQRAARRGVGSATPAAVAAANSIASSATGEAASALAQDSSRPDVAAQPETAATERTPQLHHNSPAKGASSAAVPRLQDHLVSRGARRSGAAAPISHADQNRFLHRVARAFDAAKNREGGIRLRLSPPELGALRLEVRMQQGAMVARLEAETPAARTLLVDNLPALRERLAEQGVRIEQFEIDLLDRRDPGGFESGQQGQSPDQRPSQPLTELEQPRPIAPERAITGESEAATLGNPQSLNVII